jgi:hypothetical protein
LIANCPGAVICRHGRIVRLERLTISTTHADAGVTSTTNPDSGTPLIWFQPRGEIARFYRVPVELVADVKSIRVASGLFKVIDPYAMEAK